MHVRFRFGFMGSGLAESDVWVGTAAAWEADPRSKSPGWNVRRFAGRGGRPMVLANEVLFSLGNVEIPPPRERSRRSRKTK